MIAEGDKKYCPHCKQWFPLTSFWRNKHRKDRLSEYCVNCARVSSLGSYYKNHDAVLKRRQDLQREKREKVIQHYGGSCSCCGESHYEFLVIDHVNGGGSKHRKQISSHICNWLIKNNFPKGFQVLCHNCNAALAHYGYCPHQVRREDE